MGGLRLFVISPHIDANVVPKVKELRQRRKDVIELKDSQAVIFDDDKHWIAEFKPEA